MFICLACARKSLSKDGKKYPWSESLGPCEVCSKVRVCLEVPSALDWAWKNTDKKKQ